MPTNPNFNFFKNKPEQSLVESLINEAIAMFGFDAYYIPRDVEINYDYLYGENPVQAFTNAYPIACYLQNATDPGMNRDFFTKFGLEIKNNTRVLLSRREFDRMVKVSYSRPREGDLIYVPFLSGTGELYEITFCNDTKDFFTLGRQYPYYWELELELFKYSHEEIETGVPEINTVPEDHAYSIIFEMKEPFITSAEDYWAGEIVQQEHYPFFRVNEKGNYEEVELKVIDNEIMIIDKNNAVQTIPLDYKEDLPIYTTNGTVATMDIIKVAQAKVVEWDRGTQTLRLNLIQGEFLLDDYVSGTESGASYKIAKYNPIDIPSINEEILNWDLQKENEEYLSTEETNSFGVL